jgi:catalase-peroxidase
MLFGYNRDLVKNPAGALQWIPSDHEAKKLVKDAHDPSKTAAPIIP